MEVEAEKSAQGMFYGICVKHNDPDLFLDRDMGVAIIQPMPNEHDHDTCKVWQVPANELRQFRTDYFAALGYEGDPEYHTGSHCTFCPAAGICPAKTGAAVALLRLTPEQAALVGANLALAIDLEKWAGQVKALAHEQLEIGTSIDGFKLVQKRATRKWTDDAAVEVALRKIAKNSRGENNLKVSEVMVAPKLLTPPQIEKVFKKKSLDLSKVGDYIISESSGTTLAVESDKRPAILSRTALKEALQRTT